MFRYHLMPSAVQDLQDIGDYIANTLHAPESAIDLLNEIESAIQNACAYPHSLPMIRDELLRKKGYRKIIVKNYLIFALLDQENETLNVMRVMYYARDYFKEL